MIGSPLSQPATLAAVEALRRSVAAGSRPGERPEDRLLDLGVISAREYALQLALASGRPYTGLRGFLPDAGLFLYVPHSLALQERVCPLLVAGETLQVASAFLDPDLSVVHERFPGLRTSLVIASRDELLQALRDVSPSAR